jgi:uncharacterized protein YhfF
LNGSAEALWQRYISTPAGAPAADRDHDAWQFGHGVEEGDRLVQLVLEGTKRATAGALWAYEHEGERVPEVGDYSVVTDGRGTARCVIRTVSVDIVPFDAVDAAFAHDEGEGDRGLRYWRSVHWDHFTRELESMGLAVARDMPVVCERFDVVFTEREGSLV